MTKNPIDWHEDFDEDDNSIWEGLSIYTLDGDPKACPDIYWRLKPKLFQNRIEWIEAHDSELMTGSPESWMTLAAAKRAVQKKHDAIILAEKGE